MNAEQIEHELVNRSGADVTVVRPGYGSQSDSWRGFLKASTNAYPVIFEVISPLNATIFKADDVIKVEDITDHEDVGPTAIIRLKGPEDYRNRLTPVTA